MLYKMLKLDEGEKLKLYRDSRGLWTIGIGHLVSLNVSNTFEQASAILDNILGRPTKGCITNKESEFLFLADVRGAQKDALSFGLQLEEFRHLALTNMCFQLGRSRLLGFKKALAAMKAKDWKTVEKELIDSNWYRQTPNRAKRVISVMVNNDMSAYK